MVFKCDYDKAKALSEYEAESVRRRAEREQASIEEPSPAPSYSTANNSRKRRLSDFRPWRQSEIVNFEQGLKLYGKNFLWIHKELVRILGYIKSEVVNERCVYFFYLPVKRRKEKRSVIQG